MIKGTLCLYPNEELPIGKRPSIFSPTEVRPLMDRRISSRPSSQPSRGRDAVVSNHAWRQEILFVKLRIVAALIWLGYTPFVPTVSTLLMTLTAGVFALSNVMLWRYIRRDENKTNLSFVQVAACCIEWGGATAAAAQYRGELSHAALPGYLILIVLTAIRYRVIGAFAAGATSATLVTFIHSVRAWTSAEGDLLHTSIHISIWIVLIGVMSAVVGIYMDVSAESNQYWAMVFKRFHREQLGISGREWQVLELLLEGLTYQQIADRLTISHSTVRTHVRHLAEKFDVTGGREAIEQRARDLDMFSEEVSDSQETGYFDLD